VLKTFYPWFNLLRVSCIRCDKFWLDSDFFHFFATLYCPQCFYADAWGTGIRGNPPTR